MMYVKMPPEMTIFYYLPAFGDAQVRSNKRITTAVQITNISEAKASLSKLVEQVLNGAILRLLLTTRNPKE